MDWRIQRSKPMRCIKTRGKNPIRTGIRMILPAGGPTKLGDGAPTRTTGHRSSGWLVANMNGPASGFVSTRRKRPYGQQLAEEACIFTDENRSYLWLENEEEAKTRKAVDHSEEWAEDQDGDGIREVQVNTIEGTRRACASACGASAGFTRTVHPDT